MSITINKGGKAPFSDGAITMYESPEIRGKRWFDKSKRIIFVNGMANSPGDHKKSAELLSTVQACPVLGVYNKTGGTLKDLIQCLTDKFTFTNNSNTFTTDFKKLKGGFDKYMNSNKTGLSRLDVIAKLIGPYNKCTVSLLYLLKDNRFRNLTIFAHSQGNLITSNALTAVALVYGLSTIKRRIVQSFGSPCNYWPPGIKQTNNAFTFDGVSWLDPKISFNNVKVGFNVAHGFDQYMKYDPEFVINRFRWGSFGFTADMDENGLTNALIKMGNNPDRLYKIFLRILSAHYSDSDDVANLYVRKMLAKSPNTLSQMAKNSPKLINLLIKCLGGWKTSEEKKHIKLLKGLLG